MKIYLAARYSRHKEMQIYTKQLSLFGHEVTSRWILGDHELRADGPDINTVNHKFANEDIEDILSAKYILSFTEPHDSLLGRGRGGRHTEFGIGLMLAKGLGIIGEREHVFHYLNFVEVYDNLEAWIEDHKGL